MITIGQIPKILQPFCDALRPRFSKPQFKHFGPLLVAFAVSFGRRNIDSLYASMQEKTRRQKLNDFMVESHWAADEVLRDAALFALMQMHPKKGERLEILIDGTGKRKRGKTMDALGYIREAGIPGVIPGHKYLKTVLRFRGVIIPWAIDVYVPKKFFKTPEGKDLTQRTGRRFRTLNEMTADINRDGLVDFITGKRFWAHNGHDPGSFQPAVLCWFEQERRDGRPVWTKHLIDVTSGVGLHFEIVDINGDGLLDIVTANKKGIQYFQQVSAEARDAY